ncbi:MAG: GNAT family N-acetyltransferase [Candidatus Promineifilaceae bacterium]|jgi:predicted N-acetyltransferase YhbS
MSITFRQYEPTDFKLVSDFLIEEYRAGNRVGNWLQPEWEYMHSHPNLDESSLSLIRIWEDGGEIAGVAHYEDELGTAFFQRKSGCEGLIREMLDYAEEWLSGVDDGGGRYLRVYVKDFDQEFGALVASRGYEREPGGTRVQSHLPTASQIEQVPLPEGFSIKSLADDNDLWKIHRVLWRGFDHEGEPPPEGIEGRRKMQSGPNFRKDLTLVVVEPSGDFVVFCGMWYEPVNRYALIEPLATDPEYRRMGLAKAAVWEGIRRCAEEGADVVYVGSDQLFYQALGFKVLYKAECWIRYF